MKQSLYPFIALIVLVSILLGACSSSPTASTTTAQPPVATAIAYPAGANSSYPAPVQQVNATAYAAPSQAAGGPTPTFFPKNLSPSSAKVGMVRGKLILLTGDKLAIFPGIYLGELRTDAKGTPIITRVDKSVAPKAHFDNSGNFVIDNINPGEYTLLVDLVGSMFILKENDGKERLLKVEAGKVIDIGEIDLNKIVTKK
jgi:hypothetical protein